jgi:hypothetical protein
LRGISAPPLRRLTFSSSRFLRACASVNRLERYAAPFDVTDKKAGSESD